MSVADVVADGVARAGVTRVFAVSGDAGGEVWLDACRRRGLEVVRVGGASVACVMAGVSGALLGTPGVAVVGTPLAEVDAALARAFVDRWPLVVITSEDPGASGAAPPQASGPSASVKATLAVGTESAGHWIAHACRLAMTEPWGPVRLDVESGILASAAVSVATVCRPSPPPAPDAAALDAAARVLAAAERPLVVAGLLCRSEAEAVWVRAFAEARPAPVLVTSRARGVLPDPHPLVIGTFGGGDAQRELLERADLIVAIGLDPGEARAPAWPARTAVLDLAPVAPVPRGDDGASTTSVVGDIVSILEELAPRLRDARLAEWDVARLHALKQLAAAPPAGRANLAAYRVVEAARRLTPAGTIGVFEAGEALLGASGAWLATAPGECLISRDPRAGETAIATAVAAQLARPDRRVVCFTWAPALGSGRDQLEVAARLGLPVLIVRLADSPASPAPPDHVRHLRVASVPAFGAAFEVALAARTPALIAVQEVDPQN